MEPTSRRTFIASTVGVATIATWAGSELAPTMTTKAEAAQSSGSATTAADERVVFDYLRQPRFLDSNLESKPNSTVLLYGLVCADIGGQELLLPNTNGLHVHGIHQHRSRMWIAAEEVLSGSSPADGAVTNGARTFSFWALKDHAVTIEALDSSGRPVSRVSGDLAWRNSEEHPWTDKRWVRCLKHLSPRPMLPAADRNNSGLVDSRLVMLGGAITAIPPFTEIGRNTEWKVKMTDGSDMLGATTDAMVWQREYVSTVDRFRITLQPMPAATPTFPKVIYANAVQQSLLAAVTYATEEGMSSNRLTDTRAFAQLLAGGNVATHPTPVANRNFAQPLAASGSDGHCECGCD